MYAIVFAFSCPKAEPDFYGFVIFHKDVLSLVIIWFLLICLSALEYTINKL